MYSGHEAFPKGQEKGMKGFLICTEKRLGEVPPPWIYISKKKEGPNFSAQKYPLLLPVENNFAALVRCDFQHVNWGSTSTVFRKLSAIAPSQ